MKLLGPEIVVEGMYCHVFRSYAIVSTCFHSCYEKDPVCGAYGGLYPNFSRINFLGPSFFRNKFPFPKKGTTPRRTWYTKKIQNQFWDHGGKHLWIKFQWPRSCLSLCKSPTNSAPRNPTLFFGFNPSVAEYCSMGQPPELWKYQSWGSINFLEGSFFRAQGQEKNPASTNPVAELSVLSVIQTDEPSCSERSSSDKSQGDSNLRLMSFRTDDSHCTGRTESFRNAGAQRWHLD